MIFTLLKLGVDVLVKYTNREEDYTIDNVGELTFEHGSEDFVLEALDLELDEAGYVTFEDGGYVESACCDGATRVDRIGEFVYDEEEYVKLAHDTFPCMVRAHSDRDFDDEWSDPRESENTK